MRTRLMLPQRAGSSREGIQTRQCHEKQRIAKQGDQQKRRGHSQANHARTTPVALSSDQDCNAQGAQQNNDPTDCIVAPIGVEDPILRGSNEVPCPDNSCENVGEDKCKGRRVQQGCSRAESSNHSPHCTAHAETFERGSSRSICAKFLTYPVTWRLRGLGRSPNGLASVGRLVSAARAASPASAHRSSPGVADAIAGAMALGQARPVVDGYCRS